MHVARFYLETTLQLPTTFRPQKRRAAGISQPTANNPWIEWSEGLNTEVNGDIKTICRFLSGLLAPTAAGDEIEEAFEKIKSYINFMTRPDDIPHHGSLGSFMYADAPPLLIDDQSVLNAVAGPGL